MSEKEENSKKEETGEEGMRRSARATSKLQLRLGRISTKT